MNELELIGRISELEALNRALVAENERLRSALGLSPKETVTTESLSTHLVSEESVNRTVEIVPDRHIVEIPTTLPLVNKHSPPEEKIELFMSLFRGRTDVYAKRCYSRKHESSYYIPACKNEWVRGVCDRARTKCKECARRELLPLTKEVIDSHLRNKDEHGAGIVGIYPLLGDETCLFLAVDFDEANWQKDRRRRHRCGERWKNAHYPDTA
jgi:hypothetical protein